MKKSLLVLLTGLFFLSSSIAAEELSLLAQPDYPRDRAEEVYAPLITYLNSSSGQTIRFSSVRDFQQHWIRIRAGDTPDLVLEDAPLTDYRIQRQGYTPLVRVKENVSYSILTGGGFADDPLNEFIGRTIATLPSPSLGYLILLEAFPNPFAQPQIKSNGSTWLDGVEAVFSMEADAAVAPSWLVERYQSLYPVFTSQEYPGLTLSASPNVSAETRAAIKEALLKLNENEAHFAALHELNATEMIEAKVEDYTGLMNMLGKLYGM